MQATNVFTNVAVKDLERAREFYEQTLGLEKVSDGPEGVMFKCGTGTLFLYVSEYAGTNQATTATFEVTDIVAETANLGDKGVKFEEYDMPGGTREGAVHVMGDMRAAWFKDPAGNILCLHQ